jgi:hypothetical protein
MAMTPKLRTIKTGRRRGNLKRSDVAAAVKAVIAARDESTQRLVTGQLSDRKAADRSRK